MTWRKLSGALMRRSRVTGGRLSCAVALSLCVVAFGSVVATAAPIYVQGEGASVLEPEGTVTLKAWKDYHLFGTLPDGTMIMVKEPMISMNSFKAYAGTYPIRMRLIGASTVSTAAAAKIDSGKPVALLVHAENTVVTPNFDGGLDMQKYPPDWVGMGATNTNPLATVPGASRFKYGTTDVAAAEQPQFANSFSDGYRNRWQKITLGGNTYDLDTVSLKNQRTEGEIIAEPTGTPSYDGSGKYTGNWAVRGRVGVALGNASTYSWGRFSNAVLPTASLKALRMEGAPFISVMWYNSSLVDANSSLPRGYDLNKEANSCLAQSYYGAWVDGADTIAEVQKLIDGNTALVTDEQVDFNFGAYSEGSSSGLPEPVIPSDSLDDTTSAPSAGAGKWVTYLQDAVQGLAGKLSSLLFPLHLFTDLLGGGS